MSEPLKIVVADDEQDVRDYFCRMLPHLGHAVAGVASNGRELIELCRDRRPDVIISDVRMPEMDGDVALRQICAEQPTPFILVTAYSKSLEPVDGLFPGCRWLFLTKPIKRRDLQRAIESVSPRRQSLD
jgi:response regulator NasT